MATLGIQLKVQMQLGVSEKLVISSRPTLVCSALIILLNSIRIVDRFCRNKRDEPFVADSVSGRFRFVVATASHSYNSSSPYDVI